MTTFSSSQQNQSEQRKQYQTSIGATMINSPQRNQHDHSSSKAFTMQRPALGLHHNGSLSTMDSSPYYTTTKLTTSVTGSSSSSSPVSESDRTCSDTAGATTGEPGMTDDEDDCDEDDIEIIMHAGNGSPSSTDSGVGNDSAPPIDLSPAAAAPCQHHRQQPSSDHDHQSLQEPTHHPLQRQLEFYFSRQNLANDTYLVSQMDPDLFVPIATIAKFKRVQDITSDLDYIVSTLRRSLTVTVDESGTKVKPNISLQRTTVILREMPDATEKEIIHFLQDLNSPPVKSIKNEYGNMWYITFDSEEDALKLLYDTRGKLFKGQPVAARMKSEPVVGSIQARKSALQAESSSSTTHTSANPTHHGQNQHSSNVHNNSNNNNMKNSIYNTYYYTYNSPVPFRSQYTPKFSHRHGNSYTHYSSNGGQRNGKIINSSNNNNNNNNNNRRTTRGGRGRYTSNNVNGHGGIGRNIPASGISATTTTDTSPLTSFVSFNNADRPWTQRYNYQGAPKPQRYRQTHSTTTSEQPDTTGSTNDTRDGTSTEISPSSSSPNTSSHSSQYPANFKRHSYYQQASNYYRGQKNGKPHQSSTPWQQRRYNSNNTANLQYNHDSDSNYVSSFNTRNYSSRNTQNQESSSSTSTVTSTSLQQSLSTPSPDAKINPQLTTTSSTYRKNGNDSVSSSSENTNTSMTAKSTVPSTNGYPLTSSAAVSAMRESATAQEDRKNQNDTKGKRKSKWDKKKKIRKPSVTPSTTTDDKPQEEFGLQYGTYFPPLPGTKDINSGTTTKPSSSLLNPSNTIEMPRTHEMTVSDLLEERLSAAEIVKKGHDTTLKKPSSMPQINGSYVSNATTTATATTTTTTTTTATTTTASTNSTAVQQKQQQQQVKETPADVEKDRKSQQTSLPGNEEPFPRLCPAQDSPLASTNFSYADMLKRKENGTH